MSQTFVIQLSAGNPGKTGSYSQTKISSPGRVWKGERSACDWKTVLPAWCCVLAAKNNSNSFSFSIFFFKELVTEDLLCLDKKKIYTKFFLNFAALLCFFKSMSTGKCNACGLWKMAKIWLNYPSNFNNNIKKSCHSAVRSSNRMWWSFLPLLGFVLLCFLWFLKWFKTIVIH